VETVDVTLAGAAGSAVNVSISSDAHATAYVVDTTFAMLGGAMWCTGNVLVVPIMRMIGFSLGICVWGAINLVAGWCSGRFGILGVSQEHVTNSALNVVGALICCMSVFFYSQVKPSLENEKEQKYDLLLDDEADTSVNVTALEVEEPLFFEKWGTLQKRVLGILGSAIAGLLFGVNFNPAEYVMGRGGTSDGIDYILPHFTGIFFASTFYMGLYCVVMRQKPRGHLDAVPAAILAGVLWGVAQSAWFVANAQLEVRTQWPTHPVIASHSHVLCFNRASLEAATVELSCVDQLLVMCSHIETDHHVVTCALATMSSVPSDYVTCALQLVVAFPVITTGPALVAAAWGVFYFHEIRGRRNFILLALAFAFVAVGVALIVVSGPQG